MKNRRPGTGDGSVADVKDTSVEATDNYRAVNATAGQAEIRAPSRPYPAP